MFTLTFRTAGAAFHPEDGDGAAEVARILRDVADKLDDGNRQGITLDINGNVVGRYRLTNVNSYSNAEAR